MVWWLSTGSKQQQNLFFGGLLRNSFIILGVVLRQVLPNVNVQRTEKPREESRVSCEWPKDDRSTIRDWMCVTSFMNHEKYRCDEERCHSQQKFVPVHHLMLCATNLLPSHIHSPFFVKLTVISWNDDSSSKTNGFSFSVYLPWSMASSRFRQDRQ